MSTRDDEGQGMEEAGKGDEEGKKVVEVVEMVEVPWRSLALCLQSCW